MKSIYLFLGLISTSFTSFSQSWEILKNDYTYVYDISSNNNKLFITGIKGGNAVFAFSNDNGAIWTEVVLNNYISIEAGIPITVGFFNAEQGIIGIKGNTTKQYLRTEDGGLTWKDYTVDLANDCGYIPQPWSITIVNDTTAIIQQFQSGNYIITRDSGDSWECNYDFTTSWLPKFNALNHLSFFTFDNEGLYQSIDGGVTWNTALDVRDLSTYSMLDKENGFALSSSYANTDSNPRLYVTTDGWETFDMTPLSVFNEKAIDIIVPINTEELFFFGHDSIYYSNDSGRSAVFSQKSYFNQPTSSKKINNEWYIFGRGLAKYDPEGIITSSAEPNQFRGLSIYPNPITNSKIRLSSNQYSSYEVYSINGSLIENGFIENSEVLLSPTLQGLYILKVKDINSSKQEVFKVVVE